MLNYPPSFLFCYLESLVYLPTYPRKSKKQILLRTVDKKFFRQLWDVYKKVPAIYLTGNILFFPDQFLLRMVPQCEKIVDKKVQDSVEAARLQYLTANNSTLSRDAQNFYMQVRNVYRRNYRKSAKESCLTLKEFISSDTLKEMVEHLWKLSPKSHRVQHPGFSKRDNITSGPKT